LHYFIMSVGADGKPAPDRWIEDWGWDSISDSHLTQWWSPHDILQPNVGDLVLQTSIMTGKILGIFRMMGKGDPHPFNPKRWRHGIKLEPLVLWDGRYAPTIGSLSLFVPRTYHRVARQNEHHIENLIDQYLPALSDELIEEAKAA
jgi:hypothetical protein